MPFRSIPQSVKIRGSYEKEKLSKVFLALTVIIIK